ncbi:dethiobiotin synthase [Acidocella aminolytica]|jgi:dethiobiotin synthetase|uniref:ATP-dependent dethiobiotin synthetase BioD n=1 Tax=Acidocella aminolytica 101 = DSM 11237 TaxID=1120923 RepID=A0A0D6PBI2_9PROT|nr:dethiobiotin synthase [Acidocella aminolytica]GAN79105.1 dethiobiotin synthase [Acidocella aminolytica 101 = DSM 11237]GBQ43805.1 dethiobiotin synthetase [Acidocella aminolytica 101 = DSM 11237]SHE64827.1 dethiobiotin synthetase [Acidocella aminolytica 101 = DSM 11237]
MNSYFVTATGTDTGKTFCTTGLLRANPSLKAIKPLLSGYSLGQEAASDSGQLLAAMGKTVTPEAIAAITPWRYRAPLSPDMAAAREGQNISYNDLLAFCRAELAKGPTLIEGAGGAAVPLTQTKMTADWIADLGLPVLLVTGSYLGSISHCITTATFLLNRNIPIHAILLNQSPNAPVPEAETKAALERYLPCRIFPISRDAAAEDFKGLAL